MAPTLLEYINLVIQFTFDGLIWYFLGKFPAMVMVSCQINIVLHKYIIL